MEATQKAEFEQRRLSVVRRHMKNDPKQRAARRKRKVAIFYSFLGSLVVVALVLLLIKSFVLAVHGPRGYTQMVAPILEGQPSDAVVAQLFGPDPISDEIAAMLRPFLPSMADIAPTATVQSGPEVTASDSVVPDLEM